MKNLKTSITAICIVFTMLDLSAQSPQILRNDPAYLTYDRADILRWTDTFMISSINNFNRKESLQYFSKAWESEALSPKDRYDLLHIFKDNLEFVDMFTEKEAQSTQESEGFRGNRIENFSTPKLYKTDFSRKAFLKYFYKSEANFLELETPSFSLFINPIVQLSFGSEKNNQNPVFSNIRGIEARAYIDKKVYFFTQLLETQRNFFSFQNERINRFSTVPGQGLYKSYNSTVIDKLVGYDYFNAKAYVGFNATKSINIELGHGNHFIGNGYRSLLLSDFSHNYFYLKFNTRIWKFQYQNIFAELAPISVHLVPGDILLPKKFTATHYLSFAPTKNFEIGIFETVIFSREKVFELQYLNPVILYRAVEHSLGSPDNVMIGLNAKWNPVKGISLYGQMIMDEFKLSEVKDNNGWWANKFGFQSGLKWINMLGVDHLDAQIEYNTVRPYTYTHRDTLSVNSDYAIANYSHHSQPLAHPLGANFKEWIFFLRYRPLDRLNITAKSLLTSYGDDRGTSNWGGNILRPHETREREYGNFTGQGELTKIQSFHVDLQYEIFHNYFLDLNLMHRKTSSTLSPTDKSLNYIGGGVRINIANITYDY